MAACSDCCSLSSVVYVLTALLRCIWLCRALYDDWCQDQTVLRSRVAGAECVLAQCRDRISIGSVTSQRDPAAKYVDPS